MISMGILIKQATPQEEAELSARLMRYSRLVMILTFRALQPDAETNMLESLLIQPLSQSQSQGGVMDYDSGDGGVGSSSSSSISAVASAAAAARAATAAASAKQQELITEEERQWLLAATPG